MLTNSIVIPQNLTPLPKNLPLLLIGHGTRDQDGKQAFLDFATAYQECDRSRPVVPCFLELSEPNIATGVEQCLAEGYTEMTAIPLLLFAARHSKFDVTNELDRVRQTSPQVKYHYGRHLGITPSLIELWGDRLAELDQPQHNPHKIRRDDTVILFVGRGSSDPDANSDVCKFARILWEGSGYKTVEVCFIGITHPRLEEGFRRAMFYQPKRIIVLPYFLFTGALVKKIFSISAQIQTELTDCPEIINLAEIGIDQKLFGLVRDREIEAQMGEVKMNCEMCKFRLAAMTSEHSHGHGHTHEHHLNEHHDHDHHSHGHHHDHGITWQDAYPEPQDYHARAWQVP